MLPMHLREIATASSLLKNGEVVAIPTETVYGLAACAYNNVAVNRIFEYKKRPNTNPLISHYSSVEKASEDVVFCQLSYDLAEFFWPGPLTIVLPKKQRCKICSVVTSNLPTAAVRVPKNEITLELLKSIDFPLAAPSANLSTHLSPTTKNMVAESLSHVDNLFVLDGGKCSIGLESTIVSIFDGEIIILRYGAINFDKLQKFGKISEYKGKKITSPGQLLKHYSPYHKLCINKKNVDDCKNDVFLGFGDICAESKKTLNLSVSGDLDEAAYNLFDMLSELDKIDCSQICVAPIPNIGIGVAINDKLTRGKHE